MYRGMTSTWQLGYATSFKVPKDTATDTRKIVTGIPGAGGAWPLSIDELFGPAVRVLDSPL